MSFELNHLVNPALLPLKPYQPGKPIAECQREFGLKFVVKLASNENPLGFSPHVAAKLTEHFSELNRYPDGSGFLLKQALSEFLKVSPAQLILGNGSEDVLRMIIQTFVYGDKHIILPQYAFVAYKILAQSLGITVKEIPTQAFENDVDAMLAAVNEKTRMIILANPNNPTGTYITADKFSAFLEKLPKDVFVVCDEAYYEYAQTQDYPQTIALLAKHPNLIVTRTFSKAYGLAGLRVGYGIAHADIIDFVNRVRQPFNVNHLAQAAAIYALADQPFVAQSVALNEEGKAQLYTGLAKLGLKYIKSCGNFVMVQVKHADDIFLALMQQGIIIRPLSPYQLQDYIRISIGTAQENAACLAALECVLSEEIRAKVG